MLLAAGFFIYPSIRAALDIRDPALRQPGIPKAAWRLYRNLTPRYARWAQERVAQGSSGEHVHQQHLGHRVAAIRLGVLSLGDREPAGRLGGRRPHRRASNPRSLPRSAIIAASELVIDPKHAAWVKKHWGEDYLHRENVFYRMLVIAALTSREKLLHDGAHLDLLRDQVETFAQELDSSKTGLLDDYPGECYPGDVMAALMCHQTCGRSPRHRSFQVPQPGPAGLYRSQGHPAPVAAIHGRLCDGLSVLGSARLRQFLCVPDRARTVAGAGQAVV